VDKKRRLRGTKRGIEEENCLMLVWTHGAVTKHRFHPGQKKKIEKNLEGNKGSWPLEMCFFTYCNVFMCCNSAV